MPEQLIRIFALHCIPLIVEDGRLLADEIWSQRLPDGSVEFGRTTIDVTDYTLADVRRWLGY